MNVIEFNGVWKKFLRGERFNSLRDRIPNLLRRIKPNNNGIMTDKEFWALKNVSFQVKNGDVLGLIGANGAGKSTALKLLSRIMNPTKGQIKIEGRLSALIEVTAGFHNELTGRENVYLNGTIMGMTKKEIDSKFDEIVDFSGISEFIDTPVKRYSSGMYSRLGFSVAAHMDPDILLVDEALAVGDIAFQAKCAQRMRELLNSGAAIMLVSHNLSLMQNLCKRVLLLHKGEVTKEGTPDEVIPYYQNIVYEKQEEELKNKISLDSDKVAVNTESPVKISDVLIYNGELKHKTEFRIGEPISIKLSYEAKKRIESPIFALDIIRADGVLCCSSNTQNSNYNIENIHNKGRISVNLGRINLATGIYVIKISIWDKDMIHPYAVRKKDILRIETSKFSRELEAVFLPAMEWKLYE